MRSASTRPVPRRSCGPAPAHRTATGARTSTHRGRRRAAPIRRPGQRRRRRWPACSRSAFPWFLSAIRRRRGVLLVGHVLAPGDGAAGLVVLLHGDVDHEAVGRGAVPVVLAGLEEDAVSRADRLDRAALALAEPDAFGDEDRLP